MIIRNPDQRVGAFVYVRIMKLRGNIQNAAALQAEETEVVQIQSKEVDKLI